MSSPPGDTAPPSISDSDYANVEPYYGEHEVSSMADSGPSAYTTYQMTPVNAAAGKVVAATYREISLIFKNLQVLNEF